MEEVLSKLFRALDVKGATDVLRGLQSGVFSLRSRPKVRWGCPTALKMTCLPNWDNAALRERLRGRLTNERGAVLLDGVSPLRAARFESMDRPGTAQVRKASAARRLQEMLEAGLSDDQGAGSDDEKSDGRQPRH